MPVLSVFDRYVAEFAGLSKKPGPKTRQEFLRGKGRSWNSQKRLWASYAVEVAQVASDATLV